ncbi:hypothetical protein HRbin15_00951 [bacterium HR15]|nr:hypothetical protein HRbin15_00951 [bacterium HR15]
MGGRGILQGVLPFPHNGRGVGGESILLTLRGQRAFLTGIALGWMLALASAQGWSLRVRGTILEIFYGAGGSTPQYGALHLDSSYFRMNYGPNSSWGTSVILMPAFWSNGRYYQGAPVSWSHRIEGADLVLLLSGSIASLQVNLQVRLLPPRPNELVAYVSASVNGSVPIDNRPGEAFKPVMLSSMHVSSTLWDAQSAYAECSSYAIPSSGWIVYPATSGRLFGLLGGTSAWKPNAPTIEVLLPQPLQITGWVTYSTNPNDDNVGFWAASNQLMHSWSYTLRAAPDRTYRLSGYITLEQYRGNVIGQPITVELRLPGSTTPLRTESVALQLNGYYTLYQVAPGTYDVAFQGAHWLRKVVRNVAVSGCLSGVNASLVNGDVDHDNRIDDADLLAVLFAFGQTGQNLPADLNGDGHVDDADLLIVLFNFGREGE